MEFPIRDSGDLSGQMVRVYPVTRIEGRADIEVLYAPDNQVIEARFRALEYRGFEQMVVGMDAFHAPVFLSRVCGSCGPFHQLAACLAVEKAVNAEPPQAAAWFRELLSWLWFGASHLLHATYLVLPDFALPMSDAAVRNVVGVYAVDQDTVRRLSSVQSAFMESLGLLAGLPVHPTVIVPGGVSQIPNWDSFSRVSEVLDGCEHDLREILRLTDMLTKRNAGMMDTETPFEGYYMASCREERPALLGDNVMVAPFRSGEVHMMNHDSLFEAAEEIYLPWTYLSPVVLPDFVPLLVGPLARVNFGFDTDTPWAELECTRTHEQWGHPLDRGVMFLIALTLEVIWAWEKARLLLEQRPRSSEACVTPGLVESEGTAVVDSPRGTVVHHVRLDSQGRISQYKVMSPLQFNHMMLNQNLTDYARRIMTGIEIGDEDAQRLQFAVRAFSPCVPCGTH